MTVPYMLTAAIKQDDRGTLRVHDSLPFPAVRMFAITDVPAGQIRGGHAHKADWQFVYCARGFVLWQTKAIRNGREAFGSLSDGIGLVLPPMNVLSLSEFSPDCVLTVACSGPYDPNDYIVGGDDAKPA